jgi:SRSO17 transposase
MRNIERIISEEPGTGYHYHQMQHFINEFNWDSRAVIDKVEKEISAALPIRKRTGLVIDEIGWVKKGDKSVCVGHPYCGNVGKTANSRVAVYACPSKGDFASMVDARLYLSKDWCDDSVRCKKAGIPKDERVFKTKLELAGEVIRHQMAQGIHFDFVTADSYYGNDESFALLIDGLGIIYMLDLNANQTIYIERLELVMSKRKSDIGREPTKLKATKNNATVSEYFKSLEEKDYSPLTVRNTAKSNLKCDYYFAKVHIWDKSTNEVEVRLLVIRKTISKNNTVEIKYSFINLINRYYTSMTDFGIDTDWFCIKII